MVMVKFAVDPESLRAAADVVDGIRGDAGNFTETCPADPGHAALATAISQVAGKVTTSWSEHTKGLEEIASRLRSSADLYERADRDSAISDAGS
jgi:hypothetical protein